MAKKATSPLTKKFLLAAKREGLCSPQNEPALMDKLADLVEDCIEDNGIETYEELIKVFGTPHDAVVEHMEFIDGKGLRSLARQKHRTRNVVLYFAFLFVAFVVATCVLLFLQREDYARGAYVKTVYSEDYVFNPELFVMLPYEDASDYHVTHY